MRWFWRWTCVAILLLPAPARATESAAGFYQGRTIRLIVGFSAGGYDSYGRLLARYLGGHIPGNPSVIVENMPGAGSVRAANYVYDAAPQDGTVIASVNQNAPMYRLVGGEGAQYDPARFQWLGSIAHSNEMLYTWHSSGIATLAEAQAKEVVLGGVGVTSDSYIYATIIDGLLGTRFKVITGYPGSREINLALERGEVMGRGGNSWASLLTNDRAWLDEKKINLLVQIGLAKEPDLPEVPLLLDLVKSAADKQIVRLISSPSTFGYAYWVAPGVAPERVAALRAGFEQSVTDPAFGEDAARLGMTIRFQKGAALEDLVKAVAATPPPVLERTARLLGWEK
jgi:tripartite-type tricarboxylate transporter receptor subunit TctC